MSQNNQKLLLAMAHLKKERKKMNHDGLCYYANVKLRHSHVTDRLIWFSILSN